MLYKSNQSTPVSQPIATATPFVFPTSAPIIPVPTAIPTQAPINITNDMTGIWKFYFKSTTNSFTYSRYFAFRRINMEDFIGNSLIEEDEPNMLKGIIREINFNTSSNSFTIYGSFNSNGTIDGYYRYYSNPNTKTGEYSGLYDRIVFKNKTNINGRFRTVVDDSNVSEYTFSGTKLLGSFETINSTGNKVGSFTTLSLK